MTTTNELTATRQTELSRAHRRLIDKHLLNAEDDAVSVLIPGARRMLYRARDDAEARHLAFSGLTGLPALHARSYELRPDAGALASVTTPAGSALAESGVHVPIVFDEQARHVGETWSNVSSTQLATALATGSNAGLLDGRLLLLGVTPSRMVFNAELFEKCARAYLLARGAASGRTIHLVPFWVRLIARHRLRRDQANAARCHAAGREAPELIAY